MAINLATNTFTFNGNNNTITGFNSVTIQGSGADATLTGGPGNDTLIGGDGNDVLIGGGGDDILRGKGGDDILDGGAGNDQLFGGAGDDILLVSSGTDTLDGVTDPLGDTASFINAGSYDNDGITGVTATANSTNVPVQEDFTHNFGGVTSLTTFLNIQNLTGSNFNDTLIGDSANNTLSGGLGNDRLTGGAGNDTLNGNGGTDTAVYSGAYLPGNYTISVDTSGNGTVTDNRPTSPDGTDTLSSIEFIQFSNGTFRTDTQTFVPNGPADIPPVVTTSGGTTAALEQVAIAVDGGLTVSDADSPNLASATVSITGGFAGSEDLLSFTNQNGISGSYNSATGVLTLSGSSSVANYQAALRSVTYTDQSDTPNTANRTISFSANDGTLSSNIGTKTVSVTAVNDAPVEDLNGAGPGTSATLGYTENDPATAIAPAATVTDVDSADFNGGSLTVGFTANGAAEDQLTIQNQGTGAGQIGVSGGTVSYGGTAIGTFTGGTNGSNLVVSFNSAAATPGAVQALERAIQYANSSDAPSTLARTLTFTLVDGDGTANGGADTGTATATINITAVNDAPVATITPASYSATEQTTLDLKNNGLAISDVDAGTGSVTATL
ncbi:MAG: hypothetical protein JO256_07800, partial [Alphaproteobacteria bacterium]|nr:hypothetical protein [Alphaproteobacteria bacterium]